jgi:hypothetical protein
MLKRNLIANYLGQGWTALMSLVYDQNDDLVGELPPKFRLPGEQVG